MNKSPMFVNTLPRAAVSISVRRGVLALCLASWLSAFGQTDAKPSGCKLTNDTYTCDLNGFQQILAAAKTAAIETGPTDALAQNRLKKLVDAAGKTLVPRSEHADITFLLVPVDPNAVQFTSNEAPLATLRVFASTTDQPGRGTLVWTENLTGPPGMQWFAVVNGLVSRFQSHFHIKG